MVMESERRLSLVERACLLLSVPVEGQPRTFSYGQAGEGAHARLSLGLVESTMGGPHVPPAPYVCIQPSRCVKVQLGYRIWTPEAARAVEKGGVLEIAVNT